MFWSHGTPVQGSPSPQKHPSPAALTQQKHAPPGPQSILTLHGMFTSQGQLSYCANAGVLMLVRMGADQATAAPAPIRFSILRREMPSIRSSVSIPLLSFRVLVGYTRRYRCASSIRWSRDTVRALIGPYQQSHCRRSSSSHHPCHLKLYFLRLFRGRSSHRGPARNHPHRCPGREASITVAPEENLCSPRRSHRPCRARVSTTMSGERRTRRPTEHGSASLGRPKIATATSRSSIRTRGSRRPPADS